MKIVIDAIPLLSPLTGVGNYTFHLIHEFQRLEPEFDYTFYYGYFTKRLKFYPNDRISILGSVNRNNVLICTRFCDDQSLWLVNPVHIFRELCTTSFREGTNGRIYFSTKKV
jgi:hypothetical protein